MSALKALILIAALIWVGKMVVGSVQALQRGDLELHARPAWLLASAAIVVATHAALIASWLYIVQGLSGQAIPFVAGARIWYISNLATWAPGRIWGIVQMGAMSAEQGINPVAAGAASIINTAINIACGVAVGVITGAPLIARFFESSDRLAWFLAASAVAGICLIPVVLPLVFRLARRLGVSAPTERAPTRVVVVSAVVNVAAFLMYGAAFLCLERGLIDGIRGGIWEHTAAFATSYVIGYLAFFTPGGLGVRESAMVYVLTTAGLATASQAQAASITSRLWLVIIQVLPALIFLAYHRRPRADEKDR